jgi:hypothetical protein
MRSPRERCVASKLVVASTLSERSFSDKPIWPWSETAVLAMLPGWPCSEEDGWRGVEGPPEELGMIARGLIGTPEPPQTMSLSRAAGTTAEGRLRSLLLAVATERCCVWGSEKGLAKMGCLGITALCVGK